MSVKAKFVVSAVQKHDNSDASTISMYPVCRGAENAAWSSATPSGNLTMTVLNEVAAAQFVQGEEYLLTFEHAPKPAPGDGHAVDLVRTKQGTLICGRCGIYGTGSYGQEYVWDEAAQKRHDEAYGGNV